jgi:thiamine-monophosphate kinase
MLDEFALIDRYFRPLSRQIGDDCALHEIPAGEVLASSVDTMVSGVHFPADLPAEHVAFRGVAAALSDLAAAAARARWVVLSLTLPEPDEAWLAAFSAGLAAALNHFECELSGGDTTRGPLALGVTALGTVPRELALTRGGARPGDRLCVTGTVGDAAAGLQVLQGSWAGPAEWHEALLQRFLRPEARLEHGVALRGVASAAIDVSDGVLADAAHVAAASAVRLRLDPSKLPLSAALRSHPDRAYAVELALTGGDDYELLFTIGPDATLPPACTEIGDVTAGEGVECPGAPGSAGGYRHFVDGGAG